jgi:CDP-diacylglycerol--glycerol-3-phosphate 3-phosphatidyltransferase
MTRLAGPSGLPRRLRWQWYAFAVVATVSLGLVAAVLFDAGVRVRAWAAVSGPTMVGLLVFARWALDENYERTGTLRQSMGAANALTLFRGLLVAFLAGFVVTPPDSVSAWLPGVLYGLVALGDFVDGAVARRVGAETVLGARLDMAVDSLGFLVGSLVGLATGRLPVWYLSVAVARYVYRLARFVRRVRGRPVGSLPSSRVRRPLAAFQMAFLTFALLPLVEPSVVVPLATVAMVPTLAGFGRDWLYVAGHLSPED